ncbi:MAG: response regulator, partial [Bacteroidota bacterium]
MKAIIIEDEKLSAEHLENLLQRIDSSIDIIGKYDSVKKSIEVLKKGIQADLIFLDIHLADGLSFDIFKDISLEIPVIFTTAYNEYAIKAFELNSIDYLLKPIGREELSKSIEKFKRIEKSKYNLDKILPLLNSQMSQHYKARFLVKLGENISS